jgi:hypothetical protein
MRFFLIGQHRDSGEMRLVSQATYETRQEALDDLGSALPPDGSLGDHDLFVVDLDAATPVVVYQAPLAPVVAPTPEEPIADVWEAPTPPVDALAEIVAVEEAALEGPAPVWGASAEGAASQAAEDFFGDAASAPDMVETTPQPSVSATRAAADDLESAIADLRDAPAGLLADDIAVDRDEDVEPEFEPEPAATEPVDEPLPLAEALRRAASQMESEGIVPAPEVEALAAMSEAPEMLAAPPVVDQSVGLGLSTEMPGEVAASSEEDEIASAPWPWEDEPVAAESPSAAPVVEPSGLLPAFTSVGIDEPGLEEITLLTPSDAESLFDARPMIVGEYPEASEVSLFLTDPVTEDVEAEAPGPTESPAEPEPVASPAPLEDDVAAADAFQEVAGISSVDDVKAYEPGGMEIATYTCEDCVYVDTCPKAKQDGPATCGSFQWKSV